MKLFLILFLLCSAVISCHGASSSDDMKDKTSRKRPHFVSRYISEYIPLKENHCYYSFMYNESDCDSDDAISIGSERMDCGPRQLLSPFDIDTDKTYAIINIYSGWTQDISFLRVYKEDVEWREGDFRSVWRADFTSLTFGHTGGIYLDDMNVVPSLNGFWNEQECIIEL